MKTIFFVTAVAALFLIKKNKAKKNELPKNGEGETIYHSQKLFSYDEIMKMAGGKISAVGLVNVGDETYTAKVNGMNYPVDPTTFQELSEEKRKFLESIKKRFRRKKKKTTTN